MAHLGANARGHLVFVFLESHSAVSLGRKQKGCLAQKLWGVEMASLTAYPCATLEAPNEIRVVLGAGFLQAVHDVVQLGRLMFDIFLIGAVLAPGKFAVALPESGLEALVARGGLVGALACTALFAEAIAQDVAGPLEDFLEHVELRKLPAQAADA